MENSRSILLSSDLLFILFSLSILLSLESTEILSRILFINNINNNIQKEDEKINTKKQMTEKEKEKNFCDNIIMKIFKIVFKWGLFFFQRRLKRPSKDMIGDLEDVHIDDEDEWVKEFRQIRNIFKEIIE